MWSIRQNGDRWEVIGADGSVVGDHGTYGEALGAIASELEAYLATAPAPTAEDGSPDAEAGLLPERWTSPISTLSEPTGDGRDFTDCAWTWRDPVTSLLPLMLQTSTDFGHFGAVLAGFATSIEEGTELGPGGTRTDGRFYDSEAGRQFRDMLLGGRRFGVSADPGPGTVQEFHCTTYDDEGWCEDGDYVFLAYEVIGLTGTPFPGFARAYITLAAAGATVEPAPAGEAPEAEVGDDQEEAVAAAGSRRGGGGHQRRTLGARPAGGVGVLERHVDPAGLMDVPTRPPRAWFDTPEPQLGQRGMLDVYGMPVEELLITQPDGTLAVPFTLLPTGQYYGHLARWEQCHIGRLDQCITPPVDPYAYSQFHVGTTELDDGTSLATGSLVMGMDHADLGLGWVQARDAYAHHGLGWGTARASNGELGCWVAGSLRHGVTHGQGQLLRQLSLSGDWRSVEGGPLGLIAGLSVNVPGYPITREAVVAAGTVRPPAAALSFRAQGGGTENITALVASGVVQRCPDCVRRARADAAAAVVASGGDQAGAEALGLLRTLERRTRHLIPEAIAASAREVHPTR